MMSPEIQVIEFTEIVEGIEIPCDYAGMEKYNPHDDAARWVMHRNACCPSTLAPALACDLCKEVRVMDLIALECVFCGHIWQHAPEAYSMIESLRKP